jgi:hypothetical protein
MDRMARIQVLVGALGIVHFDTTVSRMTLSSTKPPVHLTLGISFPTSAKFNNRAFKHFTFLVSTA